MREDVITLETFYASALGRAARDMAVRRLQTVWPDLAGKNILGYGFCGPYLRHAQRDANRLVLAMPASQGALAIENRRGVMASLVEETRLPFSDAAFDHVLAVHAAEETENLSELLRELWRVTQPEGRIIIIAANRSGMWARADSLPFGAGRPFSRKQLRGALAGAGFQPTVWSGALYMPPISRLAGPRASQSFERFGETVWPSFSGLVLVEAIKRLYAEPEGRQQSLVRRPKFASAPIINRVK